MFPKGNVPDCRVSPNRMAPEILARDSTRGIWEITEEGRRQYAEWAESMRQSLSDSNKDSGKITPTS